MNLDFVCDNILFKNGIFKSDLFNFTSDFFSFGLDYGDIYFQNSFVESLTLEQSKIKNFFFDIKQGVSVRSILGNSVGFSFSSDISIKSISYLMNKSKKICLCNNNFYFNKIKYFKEVFNLNLYEKKSPISFSLNKKKIDFLYFLDNFIRKMDSRINYVSLVLDSNYDLILLSSTDGIFSYDIRPLIRLCVKVQIEDNGVCEFGVSSGGGRYSFDYFLSEKYDEITLFKYLANKSVNIARNNINASFAPAGKMVVVLGSGWPGVLLHEAVGHGLEGDFIRKGTSVFSGFLGKKVTSKLCTIIDDGTLSYKRGSFGVDDEGVFSQKTVLIEKGILKSYIFDKFNSKLMGFISTGNARRESYEFLPFPRMSNIYLLPGNFTFNDIISSVDFGLYVVSLGGGQVDITSGKFVFNVSEGFLIKKGKISCSVKGATLIGSGIDTMNKVSMVGNDFKLDSGVGSCFKDGQIVPVGVGQPTLKIDSMIVGGIN